MSAVEYQREKTLGKGKIEEIHFFFFLDDSYFRSIEITCFSGNNFTFQVNISTSDASWFESKFDVKWDFLVYCKSALFHLEILTSGTLNVLQVLQS